MLTAHHLSKSYGIQTVLQDISFSISSGEHVGLVGPNGCGKTTLLRILTGQENPDSGSVAITRPNLRLGYLAQGCELDPALTMTEVFGPAPGLDPDAALAGLAAALVREPSNPDLQDRYDDALRQLSRVHRQPEEVLAHLGLEQVPSGTRVGELSGGQKTRLMLARLLLDEPNLILLDEPTNHLDILMLEWLEGWLHRFSGGALIVSHDRTFLDHTVGSILELDPSTHALKQYPGNYSDYIEAKLAEQEHQLEEYADWKSEIQRLKRAAAQVRSRARYRKGGKADPTKTDGFAVGFFSDRTKETVRKAKHIEARIERLLNEDRVEKPRPSWQIKLDFAAPEHLSQDILIAEGLSIGYPGSPPLLENLRLHIRRGERVALTGPNGCGKTTLLRTIAGKIAPAGGEVRLSPSIRLGYMTQEQEGLDLEKSPMEIIQTAGLFNQTEARHFLHFFLFSGDDPLRPSRNLSYGERTRLELALLVARGCTFLLLDEPINHLDIPSRTRFEQALNRFSGAVLAVVHDRYFIEHFATSLWLVEAGKLRQS